MENEKPDGAANLLSSFVPLPTDRAYTFGANLHRYLKTLFESTTLTIHERAKIVGYKNINKFHKREGGYLALADTPRVWFDALGGNCDVLQQALLADQAAFDRALLDVRLPTRFTMRLAACIYPRFTIPPELNTEAEVVNYVAAKAIERGNSCCLSFGGLKSYWFRSDGAYILDINRPSLQVTETAIVVGTAGYEPKLAVGR